MSWAGAAGPASPWQLCQVRACPSQGAGGLGVWGQPQALGTSLRPGWDVDLGVGAAWQGPWQGRAGTQAGCSSGREQAWNPLLKAAPAGRGGPRSLHSNVREPVPLAPVGRGHAGLGWL